MTPTYTTGPPHKKLIITLATLLFMCCSNPLPAKWHFSKDTDITDPCVSYVIEMNVDTRHTVTILTDSNDGHFHHNAFIRRIINSTNLLIISNKDHMAGVKTKAYMLTRNFSLNEFHHKLGGVRFFLLEISSLSSLHDKLHFMARMTSVFDSRGRFIVWLGNGFKDTATKDHLRGGKDYGNNTSLHLRDALANVFSTLWKFFIFNVIVVTCQVDGVGDTSDASFANCRIFSWFPYRESSRCGANTQNFIEVDRCEFMPNDNGGAFYVNYLNSSRRQIYDNSQGTTIVRHDVSPKEPPSSSKSPTWNCFANDKDSERHQRSCNNLYYVRNYFKWKPYGIFEFRKPNDKDNYDDIVTAIPADVDEVHDLPEFTLISSDSRHFFNKIPKRLNGCGFRMVLIVWPPFVTQISVPWFGMEHKLFLDLSRLMDFRLITTYVQRQDQAAIDSILDIVKAFDADLAFGNLYPSIERYQVMDHSIGYFYDHINWVVPLAGDQPVWLNLIHCFGPELWILVVTVGTIFILLYARICQLIGNESFSMGVLDCFMIAVAASRQSLPRNGAIRSILIIWIVYCFHINLMYQVQLTAVLTKPRSGRQISTPADIINSKLQFRFAENFAVHFNRINNTESKYFIKNNRQCTFDTCIQQMHKENFATVGNRMYIQYAIAFEEGGAKFFSFPETIAKSFLQMYMKKGFPLRDKLNYLIRRMVEIGYITGCQRFYKHLVRNITTNNHNLSANNMFLNLEHFTGAFIILAIGCSLGGIFFCGEYIAWKRLKMVTNYKKQAAKLMVKIHNYSQRNSKR